MVGWCQCPNAMLPRELVVLLYKLIADFEMISVGKVGPIPTGRGPRRACGIRPAVVSWDGEVANRGWGRKPTPRHGIWFRVAKRSSSVRRRAQADRWGVEQARRCCIHIWLRSQRGGKRNGCAQPTRKRSIANGVADAPQRAGMEATQGRYVDRPWATRETNGLRWSETGACGQLWLLLPVVHA